MVRDRPENVNTWRALVGLALLALLATSAAADTPKSDDKKKAPVRPAAAKSTTPGGGVVLRPKEVDGSVSAYAAAVRKADPQVKVYTNADLESMWAGDSSAWATAPSSGAVETSGDGAGTPVVAPPLEWLESQATDAQARSAAIADAERELALANAQVANLEKQLLAVTNPFSARPKLSDEEKAARGEGETATQRKARTEEQLAQARKRAQDAQARLEQARRPR